MELSDIGCRYVGIDGFKDYYITEHGDVYSYRLRGAGKTPRLMKLKPKNPGREDKYLNIILCRDDGQFTKAIHRLVATHFVPGYFEGAVVNHIDGNNRNNDYKNLEWVTQKENIHKSYETSGSNQVRNFLWWSLIDKEGNCVGTFKGHKELIRYIEKTELDVSATSLVKYGNCNGYTIKKNYNKNCNDYLQRVQRA